MADKRISQLIERTDIANNDVLPIVASAAITTNKVTVSTLQDWMQDNLDLGVTSVGITVGTSGNDVNVTGSPITSSGNITINIPTASATNRGLLSSADWTTFNNKQDAGNFVTIDTLQTVTGQKTFNSLRIDSSNGIIYTQQGGHGIPQVANTMTTAIANDFRFIFGLGAGDYKSFSFSSALLSNNVNRAISIPNASGTLALTSDLGGYVTLGTDQTITAQKTFTNSGSDSNIIVNHTSGSGIALDITKAGNGEGLRVNKTGGSGNAVTITGGLLSAEAANFSGNVGIGTTAPTRRLHVEQAASAFTEVARFSNTSNNALNDFAFVSVLGANAANTNSYHYIALTGGADQLYIYGNGNVVNINNSYGSLSDIKLKENIVDTTPKLDDLMKVKVRNYNLIGDDKKQIGVIAQELEEVFPAMIDESEDFEEVEVPKLDEEGNDVLNEEGEVVTERQRVSKGTSTKSVKYSVFVPMLIKAIQELKAEIDSLKNQIK